jgi:hypothetical protein
MLAERRGATSPRHAIDLVLSAAGRVVELALMTYRGDRYRFRSTLHV